MTAVNGAAVEEMKPPSFEKYLEEESLGHIVPAPAQRGESDKPGKERYTMCAKTIARGSATRTGMICSNPSNLSLPPFGYMRRRVLRRS